MTAIGVPVWIFGACLLVLWLMSIATEGRFMIRVSLALLANWLAHVLHYAMFADPTPYQFSIFADLLTAVVILTRPAGRMQAMIGWTLLAQIMVHSGYSLHLLIGGYTVEAEYRYWSWIDWIAVGQLLLLGAWFGDGVARLLFGSSYRRFVPWHRDMARPHDPAGVAQP